MFREKALVSATKPLAQLSLEHTNVYIFPANRWRCQEWRLASLLVHMLQTELKIHVIYPSVASLMKAAEL